MRIDKNTPFLLVTAAAAVASVVVVVVFHDKHTQCWMFHREFD